MAVAGYEDWPLRAKCRGLNDALFPEGKDQKRAKAVCMGCPVRPQCLAEALDNRIEWGVWGGMTERERRQLLRERPEVKSWAAVLGVAVAESPDGTLHQEDYNQGLHVVRDDADASAQQARPGQEDVNDN